MTCLGLCDFYGLSLPFYKPIHLLLYVRWLFTVFFFSSSFLFLLMARTSPAVPLRPPPGGCAPHFENHCYSPIDSLCQCIDEINSWMCQNFLQLNKEKTEVIAFGNKDEVLKVNAYLDSRGQTNKNQVKNLGVILETDLSFSSQSSN